MDLPVEWGGEVAFAVYLYSAAIAYRTCHDALLSNSRVTILDE